MTAFSFLALESTDKLSNGYNHMLRWGLIRRGPFIVEGLRYLFEGLRYLFEDLRYLCLVIESFHEECFIQLDVKILCNVVVLFIIPCQV